MKWVKMWWIKICFSAGISPLSPYLLHIAQSCETQVISYMCILPCPYSINWKEQQFFVQHFAPRSILRKGVLAKNRSLLWNWIPSHIQRISKGQNSENPLRAITFDWSVLRTWGQRLWAAFLMLFSGIPHLPTLRDTWHVTYVTYVTHFFGCFPCPMTDNNFCDEKQ